MKVNILVGLQELYNAIMRYMVYVMEVGQLGCQIMLFGQISGLSRENLNADLWIIEAWNPVESDNPEGFRAAYKLAGTAKCLLLFLKVPEGFPEEGPFWCNPVTSRLSDKIKEVLNAPPPAKADFELLITLWPALALEPVNHHHSHRHII